MEVTQQEFLSLSKDELKSKYPNLSDEDIAFYFPEKKILDFDITVIGSRKYEVLKEKENQYKNINFSKKKYIFTIYKE